MMLWSLLLIFALSVSADVCQTNDIRVTLDGLLNDSEFHLTLQNRIKSQTMPDMRHYFQDMQEAYDLGGEIRRLSLRMKKAKGDPGKAAQFAEFIAEKDRKLIEVNNRFILKVEKMLKEDGVPTIVKEVEGALRLELKTSATKVSDRPFRFYQRIKRKYGVNDVTLSLRENARNSSGGFFSSSDGRIEFGPQQALRFVDDYIMSTGKHEARHAIFNSHRKQGISSLFDTQFYRGEEKLLNQHKFYDNYMSAEELYTFSTDLQALARAMKGKFLEDPQALKGLLTQISSHNDGLLTISRNQMELTDGFLKALSSKTPTPVGVGIENGLLSFQIQDEFGRAIQVTLADKNHVAIFDEMKTASDLVQSEGNKAISVGLVRLNIDEAEFMGRFPDKLTPDEMNTVNGIASEFMKSSRAQELNRIVTSNQARLMIVVQERIRNLGKLAGHQFRESQKLGAMLSAHTDGPVDGIKAQMFQMSRNVKENYKGFVLRLDETPSQLPVLYREPAPVPAAGVKAEDLNFHVFDLSAFPSYLHPQLTELKDAYNSFKAAQEVPGISAGLVEIQNNKFVRILHKILDDEGIYSKVARGPKGDYLKLDINQDLPGSFATYRRLRDNLNFKEVTVSLWENVDQGFGGFYVAESGRVEIGYEETLHLLKQSLGPVARHEIRHSMIEKMRKSGQGSIYHSQLEATGATKIVPGTVYQNYLWTEEIYTHSTDLQFYARQLSRGGTPMDLARPLRDASTKLRNVENISQGLIDSTSAMRSALRKAVENGPSKDVSVVYTGVVEIRDAQNRTLTMSLFSPPETRLYARLVKLPEGPKTELLKRIILRRALRNLERLTGLAQTQVTEVAKARKLMEVFEHQRLGGKPEQLEALRAQLSHMEKIVKEKYKGFALPSKPQAASLEEHLIDFESTISMHQMEEAHYHRYPPRKSQRAEVNKILEEGRQAVEAGVKALLPQARTRLKAEGMTFVSGPSENPLLLEVDLKKLTHPGLKNLLRESQGSVKAMRFDLEQADAHFLRASGVLVFGRNELMDFLAGSPGSFGHLVSP